jgi:copper homeostasis protein CutC
VDEAAPAKCRAGGGGQSVFHRALDVTPDGEGAGDLIALGVRRLLTSGQAPNVFFALDTVREMIPSPGCD